MLRLIIFLILLYLAYRLLRFISHTGKIKSAHHGTAGPGPVVDQMKPCAQCRTFIPSRQALQKKGLYFCDRQCLKKYREAI